MKKFVVWVIVLPRLYYHVTGFNLLMIQFAIRTSSTEKDIQLLLNVFNKRCNWAGLIICVGKCSTFGIQKNGNSSTQFR